MFHLVDFAFCALLLWFGGWRLLGDSDGWLALANAWAGWLLSALAPLGSIALGRRAPALGGVWALGAAALWLKANPGTLPGIVYPSTPVQTADVRPLSVLTFNLLNSERDLTPTVELVARTGPDVLLFQECIPSHAAQLDRELAAGYPHRLWLPAPAYSMGFGIASRLPFALTGFWQFPGFEPFAARITLAAHSFCPVSAPLDVYCVQFISPTNEVRRVGPTALLRLRERQLAWVLEEIARRKRTAVVAGDWNMTEGSDGYRRATEMLVDGWREAGKGPGWSWPASLNPFFDCATPPLLRLDYTMHTGAAFAPGLRASRVEVIRSPLGSDHAPVLAALIFTVAPVSQTALQTGRVR